MEGAWNEALRRQFGAAIDSLEGVLDACPDALWTERVWSETPPEWFPPNFAEFWHVVFHALVWLDIYVQGLPEEQFAPPAPFAQGELDSPGSMPERPYTKEMLRTYLESLREKCRATLSRLTIDEAGRLIEYGWTGGEPVTYAELLLYNLRHLQGHNAELALFLGRHGVAGDQIGWVARAG